MIRAFDYDALYPVMVRFARKRLRGLEDYAEDCVQSALVALFTSPTEVAHPRSYAFGVLIHVIAGHIQARVRSRISDVDPSRCRISIDSQEAALLHKEAVGLVDRLIEAAPSKDRAVLTRFYRDEQAAEDIMADLGLTSTQFRLLKSRALHRVASLYRSAC